MAKPTEEIKENKAPLGRPSDYEEGKADLICALIAEGKSLVSICKLENMPHYSTVMRWIEKHDNFREKYTRAKEDQADYLAEEILVIADDSSEDELFTDEGKRVQNSEFIQRSKLRVEARKWIASKLKPKKYGDKVEQTLKGDPEHPVEHSITVHGMNTAALAEALKKA